MIGRKREDGVHQNGASPAPRRRARGAAVESIHSDQPTIGLITAIPEEFAAMSDLLDDPFTRYVSRDPARYTLGTLPSPDTQPRHMVALTLLGATATDAAADGCANMIRSYPSIKVLIMVGIAAGIPQVNRPERHVRLGDIVIAEEIVDYDHISVESNGTQPRQGFPSPSARLMRGANILKSDELSGLRPWEQWVTIAAKSDSGYTRPNERTDIVHDAAGYQLDHPRRDRSGHRRGYPKVHYGRIGSADRSLSDVVTRDELAARHRLLAVEMEGAAIGTSSSLHGREWFVVRGISDYGDNRRNNNWRRYASLAAAAYVRSLLATCPPFGHEDEDRDRGQVNGRYRGS
jgi:nucleoside phosphorylase